MATVKTSGWGWTEVQNRGGVVIAGSPNEPCANRIKWGGRENAPSLHRVPVAPETSEDQFGIYPPCRSPCGPFEAPEVEEAPVSFSMETKRREVTGFPHRESTSDFGSSPSAPYSPLSSRSFPAFLLLSLEVPTPRRLVSLWLVVVCHGVFSSSLFRSPEQDSRCATAAFGLLQCQGTVFCKEPLRGPSTPGP